MTLQKIGKRLVFRTKVRVLSWLAVVAGAGIGGLAGAQDMGGAVGFNNVTNSICGGSCDAPAPRHDTFVDTGRLNAVIAGQRREPGDAASNFTYRYSRERTAQNLRNFIARTPDPAGRAHLEQMFAAQPTLMDDVGAAVRAYGFDPHNVADAYAVWWINIWGASQKKNIEPDAATVEAVKRQVRSAAAAGPDFAKSGDADRQEYAEALLLQALMLGSAFEQWKNDPRMLDQLAESARRGAQASGLDLSQMILTPNGFVPRKAK